MEVLDLKAILYRSNPSVIRQFTVPPELMADAIGQMLLVLSGLDDNGKWEIWRGEQKVKGSVPAKDLFQADAPILFRYSRAGKDSDQMYIDGIDMGGTFRFLISCTGRADQEEEYPVIVRWRGDNLPKDIRDTSQYNKFMQKKTAGGYDYYYGEYARFMRENLEFNPQSAQRTLKKMFGGETDKNDITYDLDYINAIPLKEILTGRKINELKEIASAYGLSTAKGNKKAELAQAIQAGLTCNLRVFEECMLYMTAGEYEIFKAICTGKELTEMNGAVVEAVRDRFSGCCYMEDDEYGYDYGEHYESYYESCIGISRELLEQYERWLLTGKEKEFLKRAYAYTTLSAGVLLYGFLYKEDWKTYAGTLVPGGMTDKELDVVWDQFAMRSIRDFRSHVLSYGKNMLYSALVFAENISKSDLTGIENMRRLPAYRPKMSELIEMECHGLSFNDSDTKLLSSALKIKAGVPEWDCDMFCHEIYLFFHNGHDEERVINYINRYYGSYAGGRVAPEFKQVLTDVRRRVRQVELAGHTMEETDILMIQNRGSVSVKKEKRIYPNDPCPCGSGKKYKKCHGKNGQ